ncbi:hypothetical protein Nepgr_022176 [Nepenthes gracilis]|uniref:GTD-binding domain-containing protein n=1 Tax=Nepenthes gracilis TaxID=150966 RepID=A0AAD3T045_NEPGR|nr:hypothetical protein Nepgr_022176 [Nepenthes gracilis]
MDSTKFPTMLHRKTNKIALVLVHAALEWTLISLLLLNALFSFLIVKFSNLFGLEKPCILCSRIDHVLEPQNPNSYYRNLICEEHATEISKLGYCSNHRKLVESQNMCEDCLSSAHHNHLEENLSMIESDEMNNIRCSCCHLNDKMLSLQRVIRPSLGFKNYTQKANLTAEAAEIDRRDLVSTQSNDDQGIAMMPCDFEPKREENTVGLSFSLSRYGNQILDCEEAEKEDVVLETDVEPLVEKDSIMCMTDPSFYETMNQVSEREVETLDLLPQHLDFYVDHEDYRLIPVELVDSDASAIKGENPVGEDEYQKNWDQEKDISGSEINTETKVELVLQPDSKIANPESEDEPNSTLLDLVVSTLIDLVKLYENPSILEGQQPDVNKKVANSQATDTPATLDDAQAPEVPAVAAPDSDAYNMRSAETEVENGRLEPPDQIQVEELCTACKEEGPTSIDIDCEASVSTTDLPANGDHAYEDGCNVRKDENAVENGHHEPTDRSQVEERPTPHKLEGLSTNRVCEASASTTDLPANGDHAYEDGCNIREDEISVENGHHEPTDRCQVEEPPMPHKLEGPSTNGVCEASASTTDLPAIDAHVCKQIEGETEKYKDISVEICEQDVRNDSLVLSLELNEAEEDRIPDTPTSMDSLNHLHKKLLLMGRRELGTEESVDGSILSEVEGGDGSVTVERLKSALRAERKALHTLYAELEEERNAAAIAANQTMAMINRLQEEKATMQMEALHYQRMMEEQAEYDQEALQLMNDIIVKREAEKQELEKELEIYRKKVTDYGEKERMRILSRRKDSSMKSRTSSSSCSNGEESDGLSIELNGEAKEENLSHNHEENGHHVDAVLNLQDSLTSFEEERLSILQQLKVLEEKLFTLADEEEDHFENMKPFEKFYEENGKDFHRSFIVSSEDNGAESGFSDVNGKHHHRDRGANGSMPNQLLPLFNAVADLESEDGDSNGNAQEVDSFMLHKSPLTKLELETKRIAIEEEADRIYERLQALEADRDPIMPLQTKIIGKECRFASKSFLAAANFTAGQDPTRRTPLPGTVSSQLLTDIPVAGARSSSFALIPILPAGISFRVNGISHSLLEVLILPALNIVNSGKKSLLGFNHGTAETCIPVICYLSGEILYQCWNSLLAFLGGETAIPMGESVDATSLPAKFLSRQHSMLSQPKKSEILETNITWKMGGCFRGSD